MARPTCETCIAVAECSGYRVLRCRWCREGLPPYQPQARDPQLSLPITTPTETPTKEKNP